MSRELRHPCDNCPFRNDREPYLGYMRTVEIVGALYLGNIFPCHKTTAHDGDGDYTPTSREKMCAGAAVTMMKYDGPNNMMRILGRLEKGYLEDLEAGMHDEPVYESLEDWVAAHEADSYERELWRVRRERQHAEPGEEEAGEEEGPRAAARAEEGDG